MPATATAAWTVVSTPTKGYGSELVAVSADSASDAWGVGQFFDTATSTYKTLGEHFNGTAWTLTTTVDPNKNQQLNGVAALSPSNVWAVGFRSDTTWNANRTLVEHWNGSAWSRIPSPSPTTVQNDLWGVYAVSASNIWAVGEQGTTSGQFKTLIEHYNGTSWSVVPSPNAGTSWDGLHRVGGSGPSDIWAAGTSYNSATGVTQLLVEHYNGSTWSIVPSPVLGHDHYVRGIAATSPSDAWIVGEWNGPAPDYPVHTLVLHWNGTKWSSVAAPSSSGLLDFEFNGVAAKTASDAWIAGDAENYSTGRYTTVIEHWNGTSWSVVSSPSPNASFNSLDAVTVTPGGMAWATGTAGPGPLALRNPAG